MRINHRPFARRTTCRRTETAADLKTAESVEIKPHATG